MRHQLVHDYCADRLERGECNARSAVNFRSYLDVWHDFAGPIEVWTPALAAAWVHDSNLRPRTQRNRLNRLRPYERWLRKHGHLAIDLCDDIATPKIPPPDPRDLPREHVAATLRHATDERSRVIVLLMVQCGMRSVDISQARVEDVNPRDRMIAVRAKGGGGSVTHHTTIPDEMWLALRAWITQLGRSAGPLIASERRLSPTHLSADRISKLAFAPMKAAGLKEMPFDGVSPHALRHSCAQHMLDEGADIRQVQHALGHRHITTTEGYLRRRAPGLREAMEGRQYIDVA